MTETLERNIYRCPDCKLVLGNTKTIEYLILQGKDFSCANCGCLFVPSEEVFYMDGMPHDANFKTCGCETSGKPCVIEECTGFMHYQPVYGGVYYECDVCHQND